MTTQSQRTSDVVEHVAAIVAGWRLTLQDLGREAVRADLDEVNNSDGWSFDQDVIDGQVSYVLRTENVTFDAAGLDHVWARSAELLGEQLEASR